MTIDDKYTYPDSDGVLVNRFGIVDAVELDRVLNSYATVEWAELSLAAPPPVFDFAYLRSIHQRLFRQVLPFAGQIRDVDAQAVGAGVPYCRPAYIATAADHLFTTLATANYLQGLSRPEFAEQLAEHWGELTAIHPFRDGNTRSQSAYISMLCAAAGHPIVWSGIDVDTLRTLRLRAVTTSCDDLAYYLLEQIGDAAVAPRLIFTSQPDSPTDPGRGR